MKKGAYLTRGQSALEYAMVFVCLVAAMVAMQNYISRGVQGRMRASADTIGEQYDSGSTTSDSTFTYDYDATTVVNTTDINSVTTTASETEYTENQASAINESIAP
jgi:hypothetical protein